MRISACVLLWVGLGLADALRADDGQADASPAAATAAPIAQAFRPALERNWCIGPGPVSWGFTVTTTEPCVAIHLRSRSLSVRILSAKPGPGLPVGWTVSTTGDRELVATGPGELPAGSTLETCLLVETNRSTSELGRLGATPIEWEIWFTDAAGHPTRTGRMTTTFPPVLDLADAAARGIVLVTCETLGPWGPVEITVDNPTTSALWIDVPTGSVVTAGGTKWLLGITPPFRMMRRQKTGMTVNAFPLACVPPGSVPPRRLSFGARDDEATPRVQAIALAARRMASGARAGLRRAGPLEEAVPYDFWPLVLEWTTWQSLAPPPDRALLVDTVTRMLDQKSSAGDALAARLDRVAAIAEIEAAAAELALKRDALADEGLPIHLLCARERFR
jgi:hypothetical protein